jgi:hypothetical protein
VAFVGFAPGFAYLSGGHESLDVPRRATPRTRIPAGAVALAGRFSGVYPQASPGGWQIIGTTPLAMWDIEREVPALLQPGFRVRFVDIATLSEASRAALAGATVKKRARAPLPGGQALRCSPDTSRTGWPTAGGTERIGLGRAGPGRLPHGQPAGR